jgi:hypothetical protein
VPGARLFLGAAQSQHARRETAGALHFLREAYTPSPEAVRYAPAGRALARELDTTATGALSYTAHQLAQDIGVAV